MIPAGRWVVVGTPPDNNAAPMVLVPPYPPPPLTPVITSLASEPSVLSPHSAVIPPHPVFNLISQLEHKVNQLTIDNNQLRSEVKTVKGVAFEYCKNLSDELEIYKAQCVDLSRENRVLMESIENLRRKLDPEDLDENEGVEAHGRDPGRIVKESLDRRDGLEETECDLKVPQDNSEEESQEAPECQLVTTSYSEEGGTEAVTTAGIQSDLLIPHVITHLKNAHSRCGQSLFLEMNENKLLKSRVSFLESANGGLDSTPRNTNVIDHTSSDAYDGARQEAEDLKMRLSTSENKLVVAEEQFAACQQEMATTKINLQARVEEEMDKDKKLEDIIARLSKELEERKSTPTVRYSREFLVSQQCSPLSMVRPANLPELPCTLRQANPWRIEDSSEASRPTRDVTDRVTKPGNNIKHEEFLKRCRSILNKLTPEKFDKLMTQLRELDFSTKERMGELAQLVVDKASTEPHFVEMYGRFCVEVNSTKVRQELSFFEAIVECCRRELKRVNTEEDPRKTTLVNKLKQAADSKQLQEELEELEGKIRRRNAGFCTFLGELFNRDIVDKELLFESIKFLMRSDNHEDSLECLCHLMRRAGSVLDSQAPKKVSSIMKKLSAKSRALDCSRLRFMTMDLCELRAMGWTPRNQVVKPVTLAQIDEEQAQDALYSPATPTKDKGRDDKWGTPSPSWPTHRGPSTPRKPFSSLDTKKDSLMPSWMVKK